MITQTKKTLRAFFLWFGIDVRKVDKAELNKYVWLHPFQIRTVFDVGANTGQFAREIHRFCPDATIYSFEPLRDCYDQLLINLKQVKGFHAYNLALGDSSSVATIHRSDFSPSSSFLTMAPLHRQAAPYVGDSAPETVLVRPLDDVARDLVLVDNILVKIDVQGFEDKVISGGANILARASVVIVETSFQTLYEGQPKFALLYDTLTGLGFTYRGNIHQWRNPTDGSILQADAVFVRERGFSTDAARLE